MEKGYRRVAFAKYPDYAVYIDRKGKITIRVFDEYLWAHTMIFEWYDMPLPA